MQSNNMSEMTTTLAFTLAASKKIESGLAKKFNSLKEEIDAVVVAEQITLDTKFGYLKDELKTFIHSNSFIGASGPEGPIGPIGEQGQRGPMGYIGPIGPVGPKGEQGIQGPRGADGKIGRKGEKGDQGDTGPEGPAGRDGIDGKDGKDGEKGERGIIGPVGPKGDVGPQGIQGEKGEKGDVGPQGPKGEDSTLTLEKIDQVEKKLYKFVNANKADIDRKISTITYAGGGGGSGGGAVLLYDLDDVDYSTTIAPSDGQALVYSASLGKWTPGTAIGSGGGGGFSNGQSISVNNFVVNGSFTANGSVGVNGQVLTSNGSTSYWATKFNNGPLPPDTPNYGDIWYYIDENKLYMWVTDGTSEFWFDFLPPTF